MKRKLLIICPLMLVCALVAFVQPVQSFALDILSVFRVQEIKTIQVTVADLEEAMANAAVVKETVSGMPDAEEPLRLVSAEEPTYKTLETVAEFDPFTFKLPQWPELGTPMLEGVMPHSATFAVNAGGFNHILEAFGTAYRMDIALDGEQITVQIPGAAVAEYEDAILFATQTPYLEGPAKVKSELKSATLALPFIPYNIYRQLDAIDPDTRDVYLPVLVGVGREIAIGKTTGYLYTAADLKGFLSSQTLEFQGNRNMGECLAGAPDHASALVWVQEGVLYLLIADKPDGVMRDIAGSLR